MLKKKYRLPSSLKLEKAKTIQTSYFILKTADSDLLYPRFAFVVSKKVDVRAVVRNRIKREMTRVLGGMIDRISSKDMLFILKREAAGNVDKLEVAIQKNMIREELIK